MLARRARIVRGAVIAIVAIAVFAACHRSTPAADSTGAASPEPGVSSLPRALIGPTWTLVELDGRPAPLGAGDKPATMIITEGAEPRAAGSAGCNRWSSTFTHAAPDSIRFTAPISTKMACATGMDLEQRFLGMVMAVRGYALSDSSLVLRGDTGVLAKFVARP
jgi:heat shock protein HslJ